jgi:arylsulfatase A-like enzyme
MKNKGNLIIITVTVLILAASAVVVQTGCTPRQAELPNIIFIFIDDMGYGDIGPFGSTQNKTPNLDQLAQEGMVLTDFYVSSTACTPSRSALMTGCYADRVGMNGRVVFPADKRGLNPDEITIAEVLKTKDYATGCFGKWHLGDQPEFMPLNQGFDEYAGIPYSNDMWTYNVRPMVPLPFIKGNEVVAYIPDGVNQALLCDAVTDAAVDFIKRNSEKAFFAYIPYSYIHVPRYALKERVEKANGSVFRAQVEEIDAGVGRIIETVKKLGLSENTLVFFTSDNGGSYNTSMGPLRGRKGGPKYEGHMRVPAIAWWPGQIPAGSVTHEIGATIDILPTLAKLAGAQLPDDRIIDGNDISELLLGNPGARSPHDVLFYESDGVRQGKWKLVRIKGVDELYDLETDLGEKTDLSQQYPEKLLELAAVLDAHILDLNRNQRPAAFVEDPKPLMTEVDSVPTLEEYMGLTGLEVVEEIRVRK